LLQAKEDCAKNAGITPAFFHLFLFFQPVMAYRQWDQGQVHEREKHFLTFSPFSLL